MIHSKEHWSTTQLVPMLRSSASMCPNVCSEKSRMEAAIKGLALGLACCGEAHEESVSKPSQRSEVSKSGKWLVRGLVIVADFESGAEDGMFGHPIRDAPDGAATIQRFLYHKSCRVTWYGPLTKIVSHMGVAVKIACLHGHVDERSVNSG